MIKRENLPTGTKLSNSLGDKGFIGSRIEGAYRVTSMMFEVPYEDAITGVVYYTKELRKSFVPVDALPADYAVAREKCNAYFVQELPTAATRAAMDAGAIEWTVEDIANV